MNEDPNAARAASGSGRTLAISLGGWTLTIALLGAEIGLAAWIALTIGPRSVPLAVLLMIATAGGAVALCIWLMVALTRGMGPAGATGRGGRPRG
jgi:hypothetical protein